MVLYVNNMYTIADYPEGEMEMEVGVDGESE